MCDLDQLRSAGFEAVECQLSWTGAIGAWTGIASGSA
jgi:hypothetical protein